MRLGSLLRCLAAVAAACLVVAPTPSYGADETPRAAIDTLAERLADEHVVVDQQLGNGDAAGAVERIRAAADLDLPIYVALVSSPGGLAESRPSSDLANRLHQRLGDGLYVVQVAGSILEMKSWGVAVDESALSGGWYAVSDALRRSWGTGADLPYLTTVAEAQIVAELAAGGEPYEMDTSRAKAIAEIPGNRSLPRFSILDRPDEVTPGLRAVVATVVGLGVALVGLRLLLWLTSAPGRTRRPATATPRGPRPTDLDLDDLLARTSRAATRLSEGVAAAPSSSRHLQAATGFLTATEALLRDLEAAPDDEPQGDRLRDAVGALLLVKAGTWEMGRTQGGRDRGRYVPCFFNPLHGRSDLRVEVSGRRSVDVPACRTCAVVLRQGGTPEALVFPARRRPVPYYEEDTIWARTGYGALVADSWKAVMTARSEVAR